MLPPFVEPAADSVDGFVWIDAARTVGLPQVLADPLRPAGALLRQHLDALDQMLITVMGELGVLLGGSAGALDPAQSDRLDRLEAAIDRLVGEYRAGLLTVGVVADVRGGQICGTATISGHRIRVVRGRVPSAPLSGQVDEPGLGVVAGLAEMSDPVAGAPWSGRRWIVRTQDGRRLPATLGMLLGDSSGVDRKATLDAHREALKDITGVAGDDPRAAGALEHLLLDWLMAHREDQTSIAVEIAKGRIDDAAMIVDAATTAGSLRTLATGH